MGPSRYKIFKERNRMKNCLMMKYHILFITAKRDCSFEYSNKTIDNRQAWLNNNKGQQIVVMIPD